MNRALLSIICPPLAVCRYGCAGCCAAPIAVFWLAAIVGLLYGYNGGPLELEGISWYTFGLGITLWVIASVWSMVTLYGMDTESCDNSQKNSFCDPLRRLDESDPMDEVRKAQ